MKSGFWPVLLLWSLAIFLGSSLDFWHARQFEAQQKEMKSTEVLVSVLGEVRAVLARYLWFRTDIYHEVMEEQGYGEDKQGELFPLMRMVTLLDPTMTESYDQIVWDLYKGSGDREMAMTVLDEGLEQNPKNYELNFRKALILYMEQEYSKAQSQALITLRYTQDDVRLADCLRIMYWSAEKLGQIELQRRALSDLLKLRPKDPLWLREKVKLQAKLKQS